MRKAKNMYQAISEKKKNIIMKNIIENCQFCSSSKVECGHQIVIDRYYSIQDIEQVLNHLLKQGEL